jgi:hypothetical protein
MEAGGKGKGKGKGLEAALGARQARILVARESGAPAPVVTGPVVAQVRES